VIIQKIELNIRLMNVTASMWVLEYKKKWSKIW